MHVSISDSNQGAPKHWGCWPRHNHNIGILRWRWTTYTTRGSAITETNLKIKSERLVHCWENIHKTAWMMSTFQPYKSPGVDSVFSILLQKKVGRSFPIYWRWMKMKNQPSSESNTYKMKKGQNYFTFPKVGKTGLRPLGPYAYHLLKTMEEVVDNYMRT